MESASIPYVGRAFLYVLRLEGAEDVLKVGLSRDPLARWSSFHPRWFEAFDLDRSVLVETESRKDAQALETRLHRMLAIHGCPMPLTVRVQAGGGSEWYRGAWPVVREFVDDLDGLGYVVHGSATPWLAAALGGRRDSFAGLVQQAYSDDSAGWLAPAQRNALQDLLDAHRALDPGFDPDWLAGMLDDLGFRH